MTLPLYNKCIVPTGQKKPPTAHAGLWFDRFFNGFYKKGDVWEIPKPTEHKDVKRDWIKGVTGESKVGSKSRLENVNSRQNRLVEHLAGKSKVYTSDWHFISGMGNSHPVENGISWHSTLGVPYLTGAAVKGLVRAWVESEDGNLDGESEAQKVARLKHWFGTASKNDVPEQAGNFIFFDALPAEPVQLACDIMTPHMGKWYSDGATASPTKPDTLPADWHEPVPISFLVVKQVQLVFYIAPRHKDKGSSAELGAVFDALTNALEWLGAGAKTATGYGYFSLKQ